MTLNVIERKRFIIKKLNERKNGLEFSDLLIVMMNNVNVRLAIIIIHIIIFTNLAFIKNIVISKVYFFRYSVTFAWYTIIYTVMALYKIKVNNNSFATTPAVNHFLLMLFSLML